MSQLTPYFRSEEFECPCGDSKCVRSDMNLPFLTKLNRFREIYGHPVKIVTGGGYRCKAYNAKVGGSADSMHLLGRAADIEAPDDGARYQMLRIAFAIFGGVGINNGAIHMDDRDSAKARCWTYYQNYKRI